MTAVHAAQTPRTGAVRRVLRVAIVGCGAIAAEAHIPVASQFEGVRLVGLVDTDLPRAQDLASRFGVAVACAQIDDIAAEVDAVILATPPHVRGELAQRAFDAGLHVLCEKPMANSADQCRQMIAQACAAHRTLAVAHTYRFFPNRVRGRALFMEGRLGRLVAATIEQGVPYFWHPRTAYTLRRDLVPGGVLFNDLHLLDLLLWWFGPPEGFHYADDSLGGVESNVRLALDYPGGAVVHFRLSRTCSLSNRVEMRFERGWLAFPVHNMADLEVCVGGEPSRRETLHSRAWDFHTAATAQLRDFVLAATEGRASAIPGEVGLAVVDLIETFYRAKAQRPRPRGAPLPGVPW